ncbi:hypothetical protein [Geothrix sp. PMB-07]|uniref:hypothetical protein n=1 Tax=Geothrix sp. PMB-07 TaxID=3068640 RepID=UPI002742390E|nr:hypothetical protein [Geothrix sp. PMB-07]WLT32908.1 hypothetical protein Q9293_06140 [Geothrix sp. PMB-07]
MCRIQLLLRNLLSPLLAMVVVSPLAAQLNPKWQAPNSPDFLDLYQRSSATKVKPEIATIFDFSGSMQCMMYHPCYFNNDPNDNGDLSGITFTLSGPAGAMKVTASVGLAWYTSAILIRPDGSQVTEANVNTTATGTGLWGDKALNGASTQACDVRNWVRAASHIRLTGMDGTRTRTIDLPIPWKVMDRNSTGYPLSSMTVMDSYSEVDANGVTTTYGSGSSIEVDTRYKIQTGFGDIAPSTDVQDNNIVLSGNPGDIVTTTKYMVRLNKKYIDWLFSGKYQNTDSTLPDYSASLSGKYIIFDALDMSNVGLQTRLEQGKGFGTFTLPSEAALKANVVPARDRVQAVKEAAIRTWINYQTRVLWAFRFLDDEVEAGGTTPATRINYDSRSTIGTAGVPTTWTNGNASGWTLLNKNSVQGMQRIAALFPYTNTPLCYATARALAQFTDPNNVFGDAETGADAPVECQKRFLIIFTDGVPSSDNGSEKKQDTPYLTTLGGNTGSAQEGNARLIAAKTNINPGNSWWNIFTYAAAAAHLSDDTKTAYGADLPITSFMAPPSAYPTGSDVPSAFLPFAVTKRLTVPIPQPYRLITTMTIGVSLGGKYTDANSPKQRLFLSAVFGDPERTSWDISKLKPFTLKDPTKPDDPTNSKSTDSVYFFDATTPDAIVSGLGFAFKAAGAKSQTASTSVPVIPWIGGGLSQQIYMASFTVPSGGGPVWSGDLKMFPTKDVTQTDATTGSKVQTQILDNTGTEITGDLSVVNNPGWSASASLQAKGWINRKIFTRLESDGTTSNPTIYSIPTGITLAQLSTGGAHIKLAAVIAGADPATKLKNLQWMMGANLTDVTKTRPNIMGDVLDSAPSFLEYASPTVASMPTSLSTAWGDSSKANKHFRVIFVGTNQGVIHAFGEVTWDNTIGTAPSTSVIKAGVVDELWAFIPTDILKYCDYYQTPGNPHRFGVNGTPYLYFLDLPASGKRSGNGMMDAVGSGERATLIMGLGKGGRSYYALDVRDPFSPKLGGSGNYGWALVPDEPFSYAGTTDAAINKLVQNMGWSTCQPTIGRVLTGSGATQIIKDVVFLGGGFSLPEIETNYPSANAKTPLGRSVFALDVTTGAVVSAWDLTGNGPVAAGVVPMQVTPYAGLTERAYFTDFFGGLWALGSTADNLVTGMSGFRVDSANIGNWSTSPRPVYHQDRPDGLLSTLPAPFLVSNFYPRTSAPFVTPLTVGIALVSGDRNNPMDKLYSGTSVNSRPTQHRLTVVFDRQDSFKLGIDSAGGITTDELANMSDQTSPSATVIQPGSADFYLKDKYGYYLNFPTRGATESYVAKGLVTPIVLSGKLFYSYFSPTGYADSNPCSNGTGSTRTVQVCNVMTPTFPGTGAAWDSSMKVQGCASGEIFTWVGLASRFSPKSILSALQAGMLPAATDPTTTVPNLKIKSFDGSLDKAFAGPKVWRTVR